MLGMIRGGMGNQNWARLVFWLILISGFLVLTLEESSEKDETFLSQFKAPSTGKVNEQMVKKFALLLFMLVLILLGLKKNCIS